MSPARRAGFTLVEAAIAVALIAVVMIKLTLIIRAASDTHRRETATMALEDQARRVLDRVAYALFGADPATLAPGTPSPGWESGISFRVSLGVQDGEVVLGEPEFIGLEAEPGQLVYRKDVGTADEDMLVWCNSVAKLLKQELENGADDNENGLADEAGLSFDVDRDKIRIQLTLERAGGGGEPLREEVETEITCRN
jgi:hypothetical protein